MGGGGGRGENLYYPLIKYFTESVNIGNSNLQVTHQRNSCTWKIVNIDIVRLISLGQYTRHFFSIFEYVLAHQCCGSDPGSGAFFTPGSGIRDGKRYRIQDEHPGSYFWELSISFLGLKQIWIRDIPDPQHCRQHKKNIERWEEGFGIRKITDTVAE